MKYTNDLVQLANEETVLQGMIDRLIEFGRYCGVEMNAERTKIRRISREPSPLQIMIDNRQLENVKYFNYLGSMIINDARCTREIKSRIAMAKTAFNRKKTLFTQQIGLKSKEETIKMLHLEHSIVWC